MDAANIKPEDILDLSTELKKLSHKLVDDDDLQPLMDRIKDARIVMIGESNYGSHEFYFWRSRITQKLLREKGFDFVSIVGDWPDCYRLNRYVKHYPDSGESADEILKEFNRWPTWLWGNWETNAFIEWLRDFNAGRQSKERVGFYGLDVYSLWESMDYIINYLSENDPDSVELVKKAMKCFEPYNNDEGEYYARQNSIVPSSCEADIVKVLQEITRKLPHYKSDREASFSAEQNALVAVDAEKYYRTMMKNQIEAWNIRETHMAETLQRLLKFHGPESKAIVWAHNSHIGDARKTKLEDEGMFNFGQMVREEFDKGQSFIIGMGSNSGQMIGAKQWGDMTRRVNINSARAGSWEAQLHDTGIEQNLLLMNELKKNDDFLQYMAHREIGLRYHPENESLENYLEAILPSRYDAFIFIDETTAIHPLDIKADGHQMPEAYPFGI